MHHWWHYASDDEKALAITQTHSAKFGTAINQCECGAYRVDGRKPLLHTLACPHREALPLEDYPDI